MTASDDRVATFLEGTRRRNRREIVSPEGVPLTVELADFGERVAALFLDLFFWIVATIVIYIAGVALLIGGGGLGALGAILFIAFVVRNVYFIHFELAWQGATPGKRIVGLRVIDRRGGPLLPTAVIARNLTREIETFQPLGLLLSLNGAGAAATWEQLFTALWLLMFVALPFINRDRMRAGDLIAGTMVVALPRRALLADLVGAAAHFSFTQAQLGSYGAFEVQILEELLRRPDGIDTRRLKRDVCERICLKIAWPAPVAEPDTDLFLGDFYAAERAFLERRQLFGRRRADKHDLGKPPA